jgi:predicted phosphodiesterase
MTTTSANIKTRFLVFSDTHGLDSLPDSVSSQYADVAIHCGDLTTESKIDEYRASIRFLQAVNAPLKLVIAGNHDFTMDIPAFQKRWQKLDHHWTPS